MQSIRLPYAESEHQCAAVDKFAGGGGTVNGGLCLERTACWSQSLTDVTITIPICSIADECDINSANLKVDFKTNCLRVLNLLTILLDIMITGGNVIPCECTWYLSERQSDPREGSCLLLIVLSKQSPSAGIVYPGCEWWSHVFEGDERIETLTCSIGSDVQSLPQHARERRDREHARFCAMSLSKKEEELNGIKDLKLVRSCDSTSNDINIFLISSVGFIYCINRHF